MPKKYNPNSLIQRMKHKNWHCGKSWQHRPGKLERTIHNWGHDISSTTKSITSDIGDGISSLFEGNKYNRTPNKPGVPATPNTPARPEPLAYLKGKQGSLENPLFEIGKVELKETATDNKVNYNNFHNNHEGLEINKDQINISGRVAEVFSLFAFASNNNPESSVELNHKDFGQMFDDINKTNTDNDTDSISKKEYNTFVQNYVDNCQGIKGEKIDENRRFENTVDIDPQDIGTLDKLFNKLSTSESDDGKISKKEFVGELNNMFGTFASGTRETKNGDGKVDRTELDKFLGL